MKLSIAAACLFVATTLTSAAFADPIPSGYTCSGNCGSLGANGVVSLSPLANTSYQYVTTSGSSSKAVIPTGGDGHETNGSTLSTSVFTATAGTDLNFYFDFTTSDGGSYSDYAWAELFNSAGQAVSLLFDARTETSGSIVPAQGLAAPTATLSPSSVPIEANKTTWAPLGSSSGSCFSGGCGTTGWVNSDYTIAAAGSYYLEFGVTNEYDTAFDTGLAIDGVTVGGVAVVPPTAPVAPSATPEPSALVLLGTGLAGVAGMVRRRKVFTA